MSGRTPGPWRGASPGRPLDTLLDLDDDPLHASPELIELVKAAKHDRDALTARVAELELECRELRDKVGREIGAHIVSARQAVEAEERVAELEVHIETLTVYGNRLAVHCGHLGGDATFDSVRCWNEVTADARRVLDGKGE